MTDDTVHIYNMPKHTHGREPVCLGCAAVACDGAADVLEAGRGCPNDPAWLRAIKWLARCIDARLLRVAAKILRHCSGNRRRYVLVRARDET